MLEREIKLPFSDATAARTAIIATGARPLRPRRLQDDALFDTSEGMLRSRGCAVRIRTERPAADDRDGRAFVTFKGPVQPGAMKIREEHETAVDDRDAVRHIFEALGLRVSFRYQKFREEFAADGVTIALDETPVGTFVELEGSEAAILSMTEALGRTPADFILDSYYRLFVTRRDALGLGGDHMVFPGRPERRDSQ